MSQIIRHYHPGPVKVSAHMLTELDWIAATVGKAEK